jgi:hypothetical protein
MDEKIIIENDKIIEEIDKDGNIIKKSYKIENRRDVGKYIIEVFKNNIIDITIGAGAGLIIYEIAKSIIK